MSNVLNSVTKVDNTVDFDVGYLIIDYLFFKILHLSPWQDKKWRLALKNTRLA